MQKIIEEPKNRDDLIRWSRKALIDENVEFLLAVRQFKENALTGSRDIYAKFLAENSELPVNHNALVRQNFTFLIRSERTGLEEIRRNTCS